jgi:hypothetical protein
LGIVDIIKGAVYGPKKPRNLMTLRPTELDLWTRGSADVAKLPVVPFLGYRFVYELYTYSDLLKTIIRSLVQETFRKGITIQPRFISKCNICHTEYDTKVDKCEVCGSDSLRGPNVYEREYMERLLHDVNFNDQSLVEVLKDVDTDLNIFDNAYLAVVKRYDFDAAGNVIGAEVVEIVRANPEFVMLVMDREGRPGRTDSGDLVMFCLEHRDRYKVVPPDQAKDAKCFCGKKLYPAYFAVNKWGAGGTVYYTNGEILHIKKFTHGLGYGLSPIFSVWMKVLTLLKMDFFILTAYHLERPPRALLILRGQMESIQKAWARLMEEARVNPYMIFPLVIEGQDKANRIAEFIDLSFHSRDIDFIEFREEIRRTVGALWGVMPIFHGDVGGGAGLANEGLQIVVTNRAVQAEQEIFNDKVLPWLSQQLGIMDWEFQLIPNEGRDIVARIQRETMRIANAERMAQLGYKPVAIKTDDGIDFYYEIAGEQIPEGEKAGYIASKVYQAVPEREIPRHEGEPDHGRPRTEEQRFEGEELERRHKATGEEVLESLDIDKMLTEALSTYSTYLGPEDYEIVKAGWQLGVKRYAKGERIAGIIGYEDWPGYEGLDRATSERINAFLWDLAFGARTFKLDALKSQLIERFGLDDRQAENIVRTEMANIFNKMREWAYLEKTRVRKFKWVAKEDACEKCKAVEMVSRQGVTLEQLKELIRSYGGKYAREWTVHPQCRCTFVRAHGPKKGWEKV